MPRMELIGFPIELNHGCILRPFELVDAGILKVATDKNRAYLRERLGWLDAYRGVEDFLGYIHKARDGYDADTSLPLCICHGERIIGCVSFVDIQERAATIGYWIDAEWSGKGLVSESVRRLVEIGFSVYGVERIVIRCEESNGRSEAIARRFGFKLVRRIENGEVMYGRDITILEYVLEKHEWHESVEAGNK